MIAVLEALYAGQMSPYSIQSIRNVYLRGSGGGKHTQFAIVPPILTINTILPQFPNLTHLLRGRLRPRLKPCLDQLG
jgi:hypothetical protein